MHDTLAETLRHGLSIEQRLHTWQEALPTALKLKPWLDDPFQQAQIQSFAPVYAKLSVIIYLRYLNVQLLQHRTILNKFLEPIDGSSREGAVHHNEDALFFGFAEHSINASHEKSTEVVNIIWQLSTQPAAMGAWWFSLYYSKSVLTILLTGCPLSHSSIQRMPRAIWLSSRSVKLVEEPKAVFRLLLKAR